MSPLEFTVVVDAADVDGVVVAFTRRRHEARVFLWRYLRVAVDGACLELHLKGLSGGVVAD